MKKHISSAGFTLVELMIAGTLASVIILGLANYFTDSILFQKSQELQISLQNIRNESLIHLTNPIAFARTQQHPSFYCAVNGTCTSPQQTVIYSNANTVYYNSLNPTSGFTMYGQPCNTFPSQDCAVRMNLEYHEQCYACNPIQIKIRGQFALAPDSKLAKGANIERYNFNLIRSLD